MITLTKILYSHGTCPYQLEAETSDGKWFYLRYRGGWLRYVVATDFTCWAMSKKDSWYDFSKKIGEDYDGIPDHEKFMTALDGRVQFPEDFKFEYNDKNIN